MKAITTLASMLWLLLASVLGSACTHVAPWQRETLAAPQMQSQPLPEASRQIMGVYEIYEGASFSAGASDGAGAGCGCN